MEIESRDDLREVLMSMKVGERVDAERQTFGSLFPRPPYPMTDDYLSDKERAEQWCARLGCRVWENIEKGHLVFEKDTPPHE